MFSQMQNVVSSRELFNSNPCRNVWESQSCSQATTGSQNSQGSYELYSQPLKLSQVKGSVHDKWSQPVSSQQAFEEETTKYYLKYMTKPSLFGDKEKLASEKPVNRAALYKEHIEMQKRKATERDERDMLDSFIALLKDYQKEVKSALDSFKSSMDNTLTKKAEEIVAGADQSTELIAKLKEELKEHFLNLRKEMEEHQQLKKTITKQETEIEDQKTQIKLLQDQLNDCREREKHANFKEQSYLEREKEIRCKLQELERLRPTLLRDTPPLSQNFITGNETRVESINQSERCQISSFPSVKLHHLPPREMDQAQFVLKVPYEQPHYMRQASGGTQSQMADVSNSIDIRGAVSKKNQKDLLSVHQYDMQYHPVRANEQISCVNHAKEFPVQPYDICVRSHRTETDTHTSNKNYQETTGVAAAPTTQVDHRQLSRATVTCGNTFTSPSKNHIPYIRTSSWPKQSPVATVYPQVHIKDEECQKIKSCKQKTKVEDPFDIFTFDLTESSEITKNETSENVSKDTKLKTKPESFGINKAEKKGVKVISIRSPQKTSHKFTVGTSNDKSNASKTRQKHSYVTASASVDMEAVDVLRSRESCNDSLDNEINIHSPSFKKTSTKTTDNKLGTSQIKTNNLSKKPKEKASSRRALAEKRKLPSGPSLFDIMEDDDDISIQKITESLRKHSEQRKKRKTKQQI